MKKLLMRAVGAACLTCVLLGCQGPSGAVPESMTTGAGMLTDEEADEAESPRPKNLKAAMEIFDAKYGNGLAASPKLKPDDRNYVLFGRIVEADGGGRIIAMMTAPEENQLLVDVLSRARGRMDDPAYFYVDLPSDLKEYFYEEGRVNGGFEIVGRYVENSTYDNTLGQTVASPVFKALYLDMWANRRSEPDTEIVEPAKPVIEHAEAATSDSAANVAQQADAASISGTQPADESPADLLVRALTLKPDKSGRVGSAADAIKAYAAAGYVNLKPDTRAEYNDYRAALKPSNFMRHQLLAIEEEYHDGRNVGCCVSEGVGVVLGLMGSGANVQRFADKNGCSYEESDKPDYFQPENLIPGRVGTRYATLSCRLRDVKP